MHFTHNGQRPGLNTPVRDSFTGTGIAEPTTQHSACRPLVNSVNHALLTIWCAAPSRWFKNKPVKGNNQKNAMKSVAACACAACATGRFYTNSIANHQAIEAALKAALAYLSMKDYEGSLFLAMGQARCAATLLKNACADAKNGSAA